MHICRQPFRNNLPDTYNILYFLININSLESLEECTFRISQTVHLYLCHKEVPTAASILLDLSNIGMAESQPRTLLLGAQAGRAPSDTMTKDQLSQKSARLATHGKALQQLQQEQTALWMCCTERLHNPDRIIPEWWWGGVKQARGKRLEGKRFGNSYC